MCLLLNPLKVCKSGSRSGGGGAGSVWGFVGGSHCLFPLGKANPFSEFVTCQPCHGVISAEIQTHMQSCPAI